MSTQSNPHLVLTVKCAGPGCANIRRESNHWFLITVEPGTFICRPFSSTINLQGDDKPVCGQACAQKLLECFLAKTFLIHHVINSATLTNQLAAPFFMRLPINSAALTNQSAALLLVRHIINPASLTNQPAARSTL